MKSKLSPLRMCVVCKAMKPKEELLRITKLKDGTFSNDAKAHGRGAYICKTNECLSKCIKKKMLNKAFKMSITEEIYNDVLGEYEKYKQD